MINDRFARKAIEKGADGLIAVAAGAGGHAGAVSPFALMRRSANGSTGRCCSRARSRRGNQLLAAEAMGADLGYIGTAFIATNEANADPDYKQMLVDGTADDIVYSSLFTGVYGNYLKPSIKPRRHGSRQSARERPVEDGLFLRLVQAQELEGDLGLAARASTRSRA